MTPDLVESRVGYVKRILITGANSYIGTSFEKYILENYPNEYRIDTVDMQEDSWRDMSFAGYDSVFHVAGIAHSDNGRICEEKSKMYYSVNTDLAIETAKKAKHDGARQFIFMSSAIVYGESAPIGQKKVITKATRANPSNCYGNSKLQAEKGITPLNDTAFKVVILRPPMIYGKGSKGNFSLLTKIATKTPFFPYIHNERSMLYIENLCEFVHLMIQNEEHGLFWPQNEEYSNTSDLVQMIAQAHGKKIRLVKGFSWLLKLIGRMTALVNKAFGNLSYDQDLSKYKRPYCKYNLKYSIKKSGSKK